jgi:hypothetical protein
MLSNNVKQVLNRRVLAAGFVGVLAGALVLGLMSIASPKAESAGGLQINKHDATGLSITLHFQKGKGNKGLVLVGCSAIELAGTSRPCMEGGKTVPTNYWSGAAIQWNGQPNGSGCVIVGGVEYCW